jgi:hypothetical protein
MNSDDPDLDIALNKAKHWRPATSSTATFRWPIPAARTGPAPERRRPVPAPGPFRGRVPRSRAPAGASPQVIGHSRGDNPGRSSWWRLAPGDPLLVNQRSAGHGHLSLRGRPESVDPECRLLRQTFIRSPQGW